VRGATAGQFPARAADPDVCIIGAGLAGGLVAHELARRGATVVVLEAGPRYDPRERGAALERLLIDGERPWTVLPGRDGFTNAGPVAYPLNDFRVKGVGGTTLHWTAYAVRLHETDFRMRELYGIADDWPIGYADLEPYYGLAEQALGVAGVGDNPFASPRSTPYPLPPFPPSYADRILTRACDSLGIRVHGAPFARNSVPFQERPACEAYGVCASHNICPIHAQYTAEVHLDLAVRTGRVTIKPEAPVLRLNTDSTGRVRGVLYAGAGGAVVEQRARHFVLAAHAVESARLLLLSESSRFPHGLANGSGMVGRNFMEHPF
jgi:choline dehydrogenase-like flavoprotein